MSMLHLLLTATAVGHRQPRIMAVARTRATTNAGLD